MAEACTYNGKAQTFNKGVLIKLNHYLRNQTSDVLFSKERTDCLKGILAIAVVLCHIRDRIPLLESCEFLYEFFGNIGGWAVGVFFCLSGFGLMSSYKRKGIAYPQQLFRRKIIPFYLVSVAFAALSCFFAERSLEAALALPYAFGNIGPLWYLEVQVILYILFSIIYSRKWSDQMKFTVFSFLTIMFMLVCDYLKLNTRWQIATPCILLGIVWYGMQEEIIKLVCTKSKVAMATVGIFSLFCFLSYATKWINSSGLITYSMIEITFAVLIMLLSTIIPYVNRVTSFLGRISFEIYATHFLFETLFEGAWCSSVFGIVDYKILTINNDFLYCLAVIGCYVLFSCIVHPIVRRFMNLKKFLN